MVTAYSRGSENFKGYLPYLDRFFCDGRTAPFPEGRFSETKRIIVCDGVSQFPAPDVVEYTAADLTAGLDVLDRVRFEDPETAVAHLRCVVGLTAASALAKIQNHELRMGATTVVVCYAERNRLYYAWVGDSRLYRFANGILGQLTTDHFSGKKISAEEMRQFAVGLLDTSDLITPYRAHPTRLVGTASFEPDGGHMEMEEDDVLLHAQTG